MSYVYALSSLSRNYIYIGLTDRLERRIYQHNNRLNRTTQPYAPFVLIYSQAFSTRLEARKKEKYLKSGVGKLFSERSKKSKSIVILIDGWQAGIRCRKT